MSKPSMTALLRLPAAGNATFTSYSLAPKNMQIYGKPQPVTATVQAGARGSLAAGRCAPDIFGFRVQGSGPNQAHFSKHHRPCKAAA